MPATPASRFLNGTTGAIPSRTEAVLDAVKHAILAGELKPGQSLVETELAQLLGVSKTPVREALKTLAGAGLVTMSPYRGATVREIDMATAAAIYDLRLLVEPEAVGRAVRAAAPAGRTTGLWLQPPWTLRRRPRIRPSAAWPTGTSIVRCTWAAVIT